MDTGVEHRELTSAEYEKVFVRVRLRKRNQTPFATSPRGAVMDARRRSDELLDAYSLLLEERRNWVDYMSTVLTVISTQSEAGMRAGIQQLLKQLKNGR